MVITRCRYRGGGDGEGPQVNKFEQVFSDDHQMSVAGVGYPGPMSRGAGYPGSGKGG